MYCGDYSGDVHIVVCDRPTHYLDQAYILPGSGLYTHYLDQAYTLPARAPQTGQSCGSCQVCYGDYSGDVHIVVMCT